MATNEKPQIIVLEPATKTVEDLLKVIEEKSQADVIRVKDADEAQQLARHHQPCMLFACIHENAEIPARVNMLKKLEASIKKGLVKTLFVSKIKNRQINTLITSLGVTDFMEEPVPVRTMLFKANLQIKAVQTIRKQQAQKAASEEKIVFKKTTDGKKSEESSGGSEAKKAPALELEEDTFLFRNSGVKKVGKKMVVELEGPSPDSGDWVPHEDKGDAQSSWRWVPKKEEENSPAADPTEGWVHEGDKPTFQEATGKWQMASDKPELAFRKNGEKLAKKITTDENGEVVVAADSPAAEKRLEKLKQKRAQKKEAQAKAELEKETAEKALAETKLGTSGSTAKDKPLAIRLAEEKAAAEKEASGTAVSKNPPATEKEKRAALKLTKEAAENEAAAAELAKEEPSAKKKALSPFDFLKQKKEQLNRTAPIPTLEDENAETREGADIVPAAAEGAIDSENGQLALEPALVKGKAKKSSASAAQEMLDRMKAKLGDEEISEEPTPPEEEAPAETEEEEESEDSQPKLLKNKANKSRKKPELTLAVAKPTKENSEKMPPLAVAEKKRAKKKELLLEIQEILNQPLPEELPAALEQEIRQELGLGDPAVTGKELARKKRLKQIKDLKAKLGELDSLPETEEAPEHTTHDLSTEDPENTWSSGEKNPSKERTKIRAFDSETKENEEEDSSLDPLHREAASKKARGNQSDAYVYLPRDDIKPLGGAWEKADSYYAFLGGEVRYHGFAKLEDLLPLWVFAGDQLPELLDRTQQWRFSGKLPIEAKTVDQIPREVRDFLLALRDQLKRDKAPDSDSPESSEERENSEESDAPASVKEKEENEELEAAAGPEKKKEKRDLGALLEAIESERESLAEETETSDGSDSAESEASSESPREKEARREGAPEEAPDFAARVTKDLTQDSSALESFQERRKRKKEAKAALPELGELPASTLTENDSSNNPYLGVYVTLSNSLGPHKDPTRPILRVLKAVESAFGNCQVLYLGKGDGQESAPVLQSSDGEISAGVMVDLAAGLRREIRHGESAEILGYLLLKPTAGREGFLPTEEKAMDKVAKSFSAVIVTDVQAEKKAA